MPFPQLTPSSRSLDPGSWPVKTFRAQNGAEIRMLYGNRRTGMSLDMTYQNLTDAEAEQFLAHYAQMRGTYETFTLPDNPAALAGWAGARASIDVGDGNRWRYAEPPAVSNVMPGRSNVNVKLLGVF